MKEPEIITLQSKKLVGSRIRTSPAANKTSALWRRFKPRVKEIKNRKNSDFYSVQIFDDDMTFDQFTPQTKFEKWAAVEVDSFKNTPTGLETFTLPGGRYAVFIHKGLPGSFPKTSQYIFGQWLPNSGYRLDKRPHFEIMDKNYRPDDPEAEERVWIPIH